MPEIVNMCEGHIKQMAQIERESFKSPWSEAMLLEELKNPFAHNYVMQDGDEVLAYMGFLKILDEGHLNNIAVRAQNRRQGLGKTLMSFVIDRMKEMGVRAVTLEVNEHNRAAISLYEGFGFKPKGRRPKYYEGVDDAIIYWLEF